MARSFKKNPVVRERRRNGKAQRYIKRQASRAVRKAGDVPAGKQYRKFYCSWNISDYAFRNTWDDYISFMSNRRYGRELTEDEIKKERRYWERCYYRK